MWYPTISEFGVGTRSCSNWFKTTNSGASACIGSDTYLQLVRVVHIITRVALVGIVMILVTGGLTHVDTVL